MWEHDCGALPVVDGTGRAIALVTDRDVLMAAYTQGKPLTEVPVSVAASHDLVVLRPDDTIAAAEWAMGMRQIRRIPVVDHAGRPVGIVSLGDLARRAQSRGDSQVARPIGWTLATITRPRGAPPAYRIAAADSGWAVFDRDGVRISEHLRGESDAVVHAKELARRDGGAYVIVEGTDGRILSEFFHQPEERRSLANDDSVPTLAASQVVHGTPPQA